MQKHISLLLAATSLVVFASGCASNERSPAGYSRSGREYKEPRAMNHRRMDTNTL